MIRFMTATPKSIIEPRQPMAADDLHTDNQWSSGA